MRHILLIITMAFFSSLFGCNESSTVTENNSTDDQSDENGLFLSSHNTTSRRHAIIEELGGMIYLYLTAPDTMELECDCPVYTTVPPGDNIIDLELIAETGRPPSITKDLASPDAFLEQPIASEFTIFWSSDGQSVGVMRRGQAICMIIAGQKRGFSRALSKEAFFGLPFDEALAKQTFSNLLDPPINSEANKSKHPTSNRTRDADDTHE